MESRELPPPPWPLPARPRRPVEVRWWRKDIPGRTVKRFVMLCFLVLLGGCVAMCQAERSAGEAGRRRAEAALARIEVPGSTKQGDTSSRGCNDYQFPTAVRTDASALPPDALRRSLADHVDRQGWVSNAGQPGAWTDYTKGNLELDVDIERSPTGSNVTIAVQDSSIVC